MWLAATNTNNPKGKKTRRILTGGARITGRMKLDDLRAGNAGVKKITLFLLLPVEFLAIIFPTATSSPVTGRYRGNTRQDFLCRHTATSRLGFLEFRLGSNSFRLLKNGKTMQYICQRTRRLTSLKLLLELNRI